ncbi:hypothetical protein EVAR_37450_1 [Eumeta japonica]|uniref:Uncharacterized protein n=1 Tax=Eumeta variegata TaxID=151549 RepID=A0A4C1X2E3_EUMVA|nr:hypothetical protein EVAR_37450_1 [Eumeta japonica]
MEPAARTKNKTHAALPRSEAFHLRLEVQARAWNERQRERGIIGLRVRQRSTSVSLLLDNVDPVYAIIIYLAPGPSARDALTQNYYLPTHYITADLPDPEYDGFSILSPKNVWARAEKTVKNRPSIPRRRRDHKSGGFLKVIENTLRNQIKVESGTSSGRQVAPEGDVPRAPPDPRRLPTECFGIKYRFNYLRERFIALRKCAEKKKLRATCARKMFFLETYNGKCWKLFKFDLSEDELDAWPAPAPPPQGEGIMQRHVSEYFHVGPSTHLGTNPK